MRFLNKLLKFCTKLEIFRVLNVFVCYLHMTFMHDHSKLDYCAGLVAFDNYYFYSLFSRNLSHNALCDS